MGHRERQREGSGCHRGQTESCGLHQTAPVELQATPEGKQSGLESTKGEMEVLGRDQNTLLQLLVCPERPTPVLRAHGKAKTHASSTHGTARTEAQRLGLLPCLATSNFKSSLWGSVPGASGSPAPKMRMSADSWQAEGASLESCCSASSTHGTVRTEAQRLELLASLATLKLQK